MSSVKISGLNPSSNINVDPAQSVFPTTDQITGDTTKISAKDLGDTLYSNNTLVVGSGGYILPNLVAQFTGVGPSYVQVNAQNLNANGSADFVITANDGNDTSYYLDLGINNSLFTDTNFSSMKPHDGYLYVHGDGSPAVGNLIMGTATVGANIAFVVGGTLSENIRVSVANSGLVLNDGSTITFRDGTNQTTAAAPNSYSYSAYAFANSVNTYAFSAYAYANTVNTNLSTANTFLQANDAVTLNVSLNYTNTANSFLQSNDTITLTSAKSYTDTANTNLKSYTDGRFLANVSNASFGGTLNILDKLNVNGSVILANTNFSATQAALTIAACPAGDIQTPSNDGYMIHISGKQNVASRLVIDSYGANTYGLLAGRTARGTPTAPQAVANNDVLLRLSGNGYGSTQFAPLGIARIDIVATETYTDAARGSRIEMWNVPNGSNTLNRIAAFNGNSVEFTGYVEPKKGFVLTPNVISGSTTTLNIDIANNSLYKCSSTGGLTVNLSGFQFGKVVELWFVNTAGSTQTVTHGCYSNNSTINATSFTMPGSSSAYLRYFSIDGDLANTYVSIQHA
jgi:hypothetical protein